MDSVVKAENDSTSAPESSQRGGSQSLSDSPDSTKIGTTNDSADSSRTTAGMPVDSSSDSDYYYNMSHKRRGLSIVISYSEFDVLLRPRPSATHDAELCKASLEKLGYEVKPHLENPKKDELLNILKEASRYDHSDCDSLIVVFMSHGWRDETSNEEYVLASDGLVLTSQLWENFSAENCPTLARKPKMFFIQACRGNKGDVGVLLKKKRPTKVPVDVTINPKIGEYLIPICADMLIMWATYPGMYAFKSKGTSVFIEFLTKILYEDGGKKDLASMLLRVTREVGIKYESDCDNEDLDKKKQIPYTMSTLMRKIKFF